MKTIFTLILSCILLFEADVNAQSNYEDCSSFTATYTTTESRCTSTGSITISATGGSGSYTYKVTGPVNSPVTTSPTISALSPGTYTVIVKDQTTGCTRTINNVVVAGNYIDPRFELSKTEVSCTGSSDATISVINATNGRNPFTYTIISPSPNHIGTSNNTGYFTGLSAGEYYVQQKDSCGGVQTRSILVAGYSWSITKSGVVSTNCTTVSVTISLADNSGNTNNGSPAFSGFYYGYVNAPGDTTWGISNTFSVTKTPLRTLTFVTKDRCGFVKSFTWTNSKPIVSSTISITNACSTFSATVQGQANLTNPTYCLKQGAITISCNNTGIFNNIPYGSYCIETRDACYDTTITTCFTNNRAVPYVYGGVSASNQTCSSFTASITGQTNLYNPQYCIYDANNVLITCNTTGVFNVLAYGSYCIKIISTSPCYDTTITRCFTTGKPALVTGTEVITNRSCNTFDVKVPLITSVVNANYCLYDNSNTLITCNNSGTFTNLAYGSYCVQVQDAGPSGCGFNSTMRCFTVTKNTPSIPLSVTTSNKTCSTFTASLVGTNLINPQYCLYDASNNVIACNTTGIFNNVAYGSYCIKVTDDCVASAISRCFNISRDPLNFSAAANQSCTIGKTDIKITISSGIAPYQYEIYNPGNAVVSMGTFAGPTITAYGLSNLPTGTQYKVVLKDNCNQTQTLYVTPNASQYDHTTSVVNKCPSAQSSQGSGDISVTITSTFTANDPVIIKKDQTATTISHSTVTTLSASSKKYSFANLPAATYIIKYVTTSCANTLYDTVTIAPYTYPSLQNSAVYQCDNSGFGVNAVATGGVAPFSYEIIGSNPTGPSINTAPQASPSFNINNGTSYSLVRLRVIDGCGNGTLNDAGVLPLSNIGIVSDNYDCYSNNLTLSTDAIPNATYTWYRKTSATDSTIVGSNGSYNIPYLMPSDTGIYVVKAVVNSGCITKLAYFHIEGTCGGTQVLPLKIKNFTGHAQEKKSILNLTVANESGISNYVIQRKNPSSGHFENIGTIAAINTQAEHQYLFTDYNPFAGVNEYRTIIQNTDGKIEYTKIVSIHFTTASSINVSPNPAKESINIQFNNSEASEFEIAVYNSNGQKVQSEKSGRIGRGIIQVKRGQAINNGMYFIKITNLSSRAIQMQKIVFTS